MRLGKGRLTWITSLFFVLKGATSQRHLDITFELQQIHLPLDGISIANTTPIANSDLTAYFPNGAIVKYDAPNRQGSTKALAFGQLHYGYLEDAYPWLYDLEKSPTGITILLYFKIAVLPRGPAYLLAVGNREEDPSNAAGWDIHVNSATRKLEVRFGYRTYNFRCECGNINVQRWYSVHASCRNYFGFLQYSVAVNGIPCGQEQEDKCRIVEKTPNYDASRVDRMYIATLTPTTENNAELTIDELRIYNAWIEVNSPSLPSYSPPVETNETINANNDFTGVETINSSAPIVTLPVVADPSLSSLDGDIPDVCCVGTAPGSQCKTSCESPRYSKFVQQIKKEFAIKDTCAAKDFCSLQPCSDSCMQDSLGYSCRCRAGYFLDADNSSCVDHCDGVFCQINTRCAPTSSYFQCNCDAGHTGAFCETERNLCLPNPCLHGVCINGGGPNGFKCDCQAEFVGDMCEEEVIDCSRYPCRNGGTCELENSERGFRCKCLEEYSGLVCEKASDACTTVQCTNGGMCQLVNGRPACVCATEFNDTNCEMSWTPCEPNPCSHGATCAQDGRHFKCLCPPGFLGTKCEEDINECLDKNATCAGNATCENTIGSFLCQCPAGYALPDCLNPIDLCSSSPCLNGATCNPQPLSYTCTCTPGYVGQHCDIKGADRCTVTASEERIVAGRYVTYVLQCASLGDKAKFYFNMGDRFYFYSTDPIYTASASDAVRARTRIELTLQLPSERYLYYYKHWFSSPGEYSLTVQVYNGEYPTAKYITIVLVDPYPDICFPTVSIINGGWNVSSGPLFHRSQYFVMQSSVTKPFFNTKCSHYIFVYEWTLYKLTVGHPIPELLEDWTGPRKSNEVTHDELIKDIKKNVKYLASPSNTFMYGLYMDMLKVTATSNDTVLSFNQAAQTFATITPFLTTIVTDIQNFITNLASPMADIKKEADKANAFKELLLASNILTEAVNTMNQAVANLTNIQPSIPTNSSALTEAANAKVESIKPNGVVVTKVPPDPSSTIPIVPPRKAAEIMDDVLKLMEGMVEAVNSTVKAAVNVSKAITTADTSMDDATNSVKTAEATMVHNVNMFKEHATNMTEKLNIMKKAKMAIDSDLINLDRGWFHITPTPIKLEIKGGTKRIVSLADSIILDASNPQFSWDPDDATPAESQTLTYYWFGTPPGGAFPERFLPLPPVSVETLVGNGCFYPTCSGFIPNSKGQKTFTIPGPLREGVYIFKVAVEVQRNLEGRTPPVLTPYIGTATQMVTVVPDGFPSVEVNCLKSNCGARIDAGERFALEGTCTHCDQAAFLWEVLSTSDQDFDKKYIWLNDSRNHSRTEFNKTWPIFAALPQAFPLDLPEALYRFKFTVTMPDNKTSATAEYSGRINEPPSGGKCVVDPTEGYELETLFDIECRDFIDKDHDLPLMYRFHYHNGEEKVVAPNDTIDMAGTLLYYNIDPFLPATVLSRGDPKRNYSAEIYVGVYDALGSVHVLKFDIKVFVRTQSAEELFKSLQNFMSPGGLLARNLDAKNDQGTAQAALVISRQLNNPLLENRTENSLQPQEKTEIRSTLVSALGTVPVNSLGAVQQVAASLSQVVGDPHEISGPSQASSSNILVNLADRLAIDMRIDAGPQEMEETAGFMIRAMTNVFDAIDHRKPQIAPAAAVPTDSAPPPAAVVPVVDPEAEKAGTNCVKSLNSVMKSYGATKIVGEDPTEFASADMLVGVQHQKAADVKSRIATGKMKGYLEIPDDMGEKLEGKSVQVQTMLSENNLYAWAPTSTDVNTPNVELSFADSKTQDAKPLKDLKKPIHVAFPLKHEAEENGISRGGNISLEQWTLSMPAMFYSSMNMTLQKITEVPMNKSVVVRLSLKTSHNSKLSVLASFEQPALEDASKDEQIGKTVEGFEDNGQHELKEFYFVYPADKRKKDTTVVYVAVVAGEFAEYRDPKSKKTVDNAPANLVKNITYNFTAFAVACMYWEESVKDWSTFGCSVSDRTTAKMIHCDCDHTSVFSAGLFVPPNKLEPIDPAKLALMFFQNPLILITCAIIWVIYFVTLIYARVLDKKEEEKRGVHVLLDNDPNDFYFYVLTVSTGARPKAGTSSKVGIILKGAYAQTDPHILNDVLDMKFFETGGEDSFLLATSDSLGDLLAISIWHNGEGSRPGWFVDEVLVRNVQTNEVFFFLPNRWLSADKEDLQLSAEIPVSSHDDLTSTYYRFTAFTTSGIRDSHLWISIFFRPPRSPFTRAQRATCILSLLLTTMLANIMFYGVPNKDPNQQRSFKGFEFNWTQIALGIQSALVVLPVNLGVIYLFQNAKSRHARGLEDVAETDIPKKPPPPKQHLSKTYLKPAMLKLFRFNRPIRKLFVRPLRIERLDNSPLIQHTEHNLPFWTKRIAWMVGLGTAVASTVVVVWFGLMYGRTKSQEWLASFFTALAIDVFISQPLKVLLISFLVAAIMHKPPPREHEGTVVSAYSEFTPGAVKDIRNRLGYQPPSSEWVAAVRKLVSLQERMQTWFMDIGWFVLFMFSVFIFIYGNTPLGGSGVRRSLESMFIGGEEENALLSKVNTVEMMWVYLEHTFLASYTPEKIARPPLLDKSAHFLGDEANLCLGPARLRQVRIPRENCSIDYRVVDFNMTCLPEYSIFLHDTRSFLPGWVLPNITTTPNSTNTTDSTTIPSSTPDATNTFTSDKDLDVQLDSNDTHNPWSYRNASELGIGHFMANLNTYLGGGYVSVIPQGRPKAVEAIKELKHSAWIDDLTRAVFLQMNTYNPSTNVFSIMFIVFEFHQSGLVIPFHRIDTIRLMYTDPMTPLDLAAIGFGICAVIFLSFLSVSLIKDIADTVFQRSWKYFKDPWNWLEVFIVGLGWGTGVLYTHSQWNKMAAVKLILKAPQDQFVSFYFVVLTELAFLAMAALFLFVCSVKLLKIVRINRKVNALFYVMKDARVPLVGYGMSLLLAMIPFIIAGHVIFGRSLKRHATFASSLMTLVRVMVPDIEGLFEEYSAAERLLGPIYFTTAVITTIFIYTNVLVSLIMIVYEKTLEERKEKIDRDAELADFVMERFKRLLGIRVEHSVVDFSKFPAAVALREMTKHLKNFDAKPKTVELAEWGNFLEVAELRRLIQNVAQDIRNSGIADKGPQLELGFRTDYASHTHDWFFVHGIPTKDIDGPRSFPVDRVTLATGIMEGMDGLQEKDVVGLAGYNWDQLTIHQNLLADTKLAVDLVLNPEPPPPLSAPISAPRTTKKKRLRNAVRSSQSQPTFGKQIPNKK